MKELLVKKKKKGADHISVPSFLCHKETDVYGKPPCLPENIDENKGWGSGKEKKIWIKDIGTF